MPKLIAILVAAAIGLASVSVIAAEQPGKSESTGTKIKKAVSKTSAKIKKVFNNNSAKSNANKKKRPIAI